MKTHEVPQDQTFITGISRELCYAKNEQGKYVPSLSTGWQVKHEALVEAWDDIKMRVENARNEVLKGVKSPVYYYMELNLMDVSLLALYTGIWKFNVKRHLKPLIFARLKEKTLKKYAHAFDISIDKLKNFNLDD